MIRFGARRRGLAGRIRRLARCERGQDVAEMTLVMPFLLLFVLGVVEFGTIFGVQQTLSSLSREGANIAARGATLDEVNDLMMETGAPVGLPTRGGSISTRVVVQDGEAVVVEQVASPGYDGQSRVGGVDDVAPGMAGAGSNEGMTFHVVELFLAHAERTPLGEAFGTGVPDTLYTRAVF